MTDEPRFSYFTFTLRRGSDELDAVALITYLAMRGIEARWVGGRFPYEDDPALVEVEAEMGGLVDALDIAREAGASRRESVLLWTLDDESEVAGAECSYSAHVLDPQEFGG
ncbi:MAG: hypothetical protein KY447_09360 [Actinobacteria bacterium]|nr:hypothetical protein [Actinomycetota bacterium]